MRSQSEIKVKIILRGISEDTYGKQMETILKRIQEYIGTDRNKLLQAKADIKSAKGSKDISVQMSIMAVTISIISLFIAALPDNDFFCNLKMIFAVMAGVFSIIGFIKIIKFMHLMKNYNKIQVALEAYERQLNSRNIKLKHKIIKNFKNRLTFIGK